MSTTAYIIQLEPGVWIAGRLGYRLRTTERETARRYKTLAAARGRLTRARRNNPYPNATIEVA